MPSRNGHAIAADPLHGAVAGSPSQNPSCSSCQASRPATGLFGGEPDGAGVAIAASLPTGRADTAVSGAVVDVPCEQLRDGGGRLRAEKGYELDEEWR